MMTHLDNPSEEIAQLREISRVAFEMLFAIFDGESKIIAVCPIKMKAPLRMC